MFHKLYQSLLFTIVIAGFVACNNNCEDSVVSVRYQFENILDISYTPDSLSNGKGWFADAGSWVGYTIPENTQWVNGFCGPFSLDIDRRQWLAKSAVDVSFADYEYDVFVPDSTNYFPGEIYISAHSPQGVISQTLHFIDASNALLTVTTKEEKALMFTGQEWGNDLKVSTNKNYVIARHSSGETVLLTFNPDITLKDRPNNYQAISNDRETQVVISFFTSEKELAVGLQKC